MDGVKVGLGRRGMTVEAARQCTKYRKEWPFLLGSCVLSHRRLRSGGLSPGEGWDAIT